MAHNMTRGASWLATARAAVARAVIASLGWTTAYADHPEAVNPASTLDHGVVQTDLHTESALIRLDISVDVQLGDGRPAEGAVVVTSAGGHAVSDVDGKASLTVDVGRSTHSLRATAAWTSQGVNHLGSVPLHVSAGDRQALVEVIVLSAEGTCTPTWLPTLTTVSRDVLALTVFDDGSGDGPALFVGGAFTDVAGLRVNRIARWNGTSWQSLGAGLDGEAPPLPHVRTMAVFDDGLGEGPALYVGGYFATAGDVEVNNIAKWDGQQWSDVGGGVGGVFQTVDAMAVFDDGSGSGPALYVGGPFSSAGKVSTNGVARWDGSDWSALGTGMGGPFPYVRSLAVFDDGAGAALYVGGQFTEAGGQPADRIARWNGESWSALGSGANHTVRALIVFDDGSEDGAALYAGGMFTIAGGVGVNGVAKWNGSGWLPLGSGLDGSASVFEIYDDGTGGGPALFVGGQFTVAGGIPANYIARWDGSSWSALDSEMDWRVRSLRVFDDPTEEGPVLYVGGEFVVSPHGDQYFAKWGGCAVHALSVHFDIRPGSCPNPLNRTSQGVVPTAVLGTDDFDVSSIDTDTVRLRRADGVGGAVVPLNGPPGPGITIGDAGTPVSGQDPCECHALSGDGFDDLQLKFNIPELVAELELNDLPPNVTVELIIGGELYDGTSFTGSDCVRLVGNAGIAEAIQLLSSWGKCPSNTQCASDLNDDGVVDAEDLLILLGRWNRSPSSAISTSSGEGRDALRRGRFHR